MVREETLKARPSKPGSHVTAIVGANAKLRQWEVFARNYESRRHALSDLNQNLA